MKKQILVLIFTFTISSSSFAQETVKEDSASLNKMKLNAVRLELTLLESLNIHYQRVLKRAKHPFVISGGLAVSSYWTPHILDLSFYKSFYHQSWFSPFFGIGTLFWFEYEPSPADRELREWFRNQGEPALDLRPPFSFGFYPLLGLTSNFSKKWDMQMLFTPRFSYGRMNVFGAPSGVYGLITSLPVVKLNFGFKF